MTDPISLADARRRRDERLDMIRMIADFATTLPWSQDVREHPDFAIRFPAACLVDMEAAQDELTRRLAIIAEAGSQLDLPGRVGLCATAADWLRERPHITSPLVDDGFREAFGHLTRAELVLTTIFLQGSQ